MMKAVFGLALVLQLTVALHAEEFLLTNGDRVTGSIIAADADGLQVKSDLLGEAVKSISGDQKLYMSLKDGRLVSGALSVSGSQVRMETAPGQSIASHVNQVEAIRSAGRQKEFERLSHPRLYELWAGSLDAGLSLAEGNTDVLTFTVDGRVHAPHATTGSAFITPRCSTATRRWRRHPPRPTRSAAAQGTTEIWGRGSMVSALPILIPTSFRTWTCATCWAEDSAGA